MFACFTHTHYYQTTYIQVDNLEVIPMADVIGGRSAGQDECNGLQCDDTVPVQNLLYPPGNDGDSGAEGSYGALLRGAVTAGAQAEG
jgi:hypothetical protein